MNVVSIGGASRSGSTLLALLLGRLGRSFVVGELRYVWTRGYSQNQLCGCGEPFRRCEFWREVIEETYGRFDRVPVKELAALQRAVGQMWHLPTLLSPVASRRRRSVVRGYAEHLAVLTSAILKVSGADTIVDSSKLPTYCYLLSQMPDAEIRLIHLVRDSRAVAFSFMRKKRKPDIHWKQAYMRRFSPFESSLDWNLLNVGMEMVRRTPVRSDLVRYEDLALDPDAVLDRLVPSAANGSRGREVRLDINHSVSGNPLRFSHGTITIRPDREWMALMKRGDRSVVTAMTWPLLVRYGYQSIV